MSFSSDIKQELCRVENFNRESLRAELYGVLLFGRTFREDKIVFKTESADAGRRVTLLLENLYMPIIERQTALRVRTGENRLYKIMLVDSNDCRRIFEDFGHTKGQVTRRVNRANLAAEECAAAFVRGVFLSCGSVSDPMKSYHAEFCVPYKMGAPIQAMEIMGTKAVKQVRNNVNRRINSEVANITKVASASAKQLEAIETIQRTVGLESLPDDLKEIAYLRLENPEMSLRALGENLSPPISRSGANHRIQRLMEYADLKEE